MNRRITTCILLVVTLALAAALGAGVRGAFGASPSPGGGGHQKVTLQIGWTEKVDNLNPFIGYQTVSYAVYEVNYDRLVNYNADTLQPEPGVAQSWEHSADGKTWTFHIRHDIKFQDGQPLTAKDVAFTFTYIVDNKMGAFTNYTQGITSATAIDDYTVQIVTDKPKASILQMWVPILPEHIWSKIKPSAAQTTFQNPPPCVGSGPFQTVEYRKSEFVRMEANKQYWGGAPAVDELIFRFYTNQDTMVQDLKQGAIQYAQVPPAQFKAMQNTPGLTLAKAQEDTFENLGMNCFTGPSHGNPVLKDPAFRHALNWAIDRDTIARIAYAGAAVPATGFLPGGYWKAPLDYHWEPTSDQKYAYDLDRAGQELDAAGYPLKNGVRVDHQGKPIKLRLWPVDDKEAAIGAAKLIAGSLKQIGIGVELRTVDDGTASAGMYNMDNGVFTPDYDLFIWYWSGDFDPGFLLSIFTTQQINSWSDCAWSDKQYDALFAKQDSELDGQKRKDLIWQMQQIVYDQSPYIVFAYAQTLEAYDTAHWEGWVKQPAGTGSVQNSWSYKLVRPKAAAAAGGGGSSVGLIVAIAAAVVVIVAVVVWLMRRGRMQAVEE